MLSKTICERLWHCHREIESANKLLEEIKPIIEKNIENKRNRVLQKGLKDTWGKERELELGVPSGETSSRLFGVSFDLAVPIINAHIANKTAELAELNEIARLEIVTGSGE